MSTENVTCHIITDEIEEIEENVNNSEDPIRLDKTGEEEAIGVDKSKEEEMSDTIGVDQEQEENEEKVEDQTREKQGPKKRKRSITAVVNTLYQRKKKTTEGIMTRQRTRLCLGQPPNRKSYVEEDSSETGEENSETEEENIETEEKNSETDTTDKWKEELKQKWLDIKNIVEKHHPSPGKVSKGNNFYEKFVIEPTLK